jgi:hypothetical protein
VIGRQTVIVQADGYAQVALQSDGGSTGQCHRPTNYFTQTVQLTPQPGVTYPGIGECLDMSVQVDMATRTDLATTD